MVQLISTEILPYANFIPKEFVGQIMTMLNKGSIHSQSSSFTGIVAEWQKVQKNVFISTRQYQKCWQYLF